MIENLLLIVFVLDRFYPGVCKRSTNSISSKSFMGRVENWSVDGLLFADNMDDWDEAKLEEVVEKKHGESNKKKATTTNIVSLCSY